MLLYPLFVYFLPNQKNNMLPSTRRQHCQGLLGFETKAKYYFEVQSQAHKMSSI